MADYLQFPSKFNESKQAAIRYDLLRATRDTAFSSELPEQIAQTIKIVQKLAPGKKRRVLDATAHVGGFSLVWAKTHLHDDVTAVEIDPYVFSALQHNVKALQLKNVKPINADIAEFIKTVTVPYDIIYMDPPWGGPGYRHKKVVQLRLGRQTAPDFIRAVWAKKIARWVIFKAPINYEIRSLTFPYTVQTVMRQGKSTPDYLLIIVKIE